MVSSLFCQAKKKAGAFAPTQLSYVNIITTTKHPAVRIDKCCYDDDAILE